MSQISSTVSSLPPQSHSFSIILCAERAAGAWLVQSADRRKTFPDLIAAESLISKAKQWLCDKCERAIITQNHREKESRY